MVCHQQLSRALPHQIQLLARTHEGPSQIRRHRAGEHSRVGLYLQLDSSGQDLQADCRAADDLQAGDWLGDGKRRPFRAVPAGAADKIADECHPGRGVQCNLEVLPE